MRCARRGTRCAGRRAREQRRAAIEAAGAEVWIGDPDRIATISYALADVTILCWLMGSATGPPEQVAALHGSRLRMLLERTIDTTVRGLLYEAAGSVDPALLAAGSETVRAACGYSEIPHALLDADPADHDAWLAAALRAIDGCSRTSAPERRRYPRTQKRLKADRSLEVPPMADYAKDVLVEPEWLQQHLDDDGIRIVEVDENPALYAEAHIPGAIGFDWQKDLQDQVKRDFLGPEEFGELFGAHGISNDHRSCSTATATTGSPPTPTGTSSTTGTTT